MTIGAYIWGMRFLASASAFALILVFSYQEPQSGGSAALILFYLSLFFFLWSLCALFLLSWRSQLSGNRNAPRISLRQSALISIIGTSLLILQGFRMLVWWDGLLVVVAVFLAELYFLSRD